MGSSQRRRKTDLKLAHSSEWRDVAAEAQKRPLKDRLIGAAVCVVTVAAGAFCLWFILPTL